MSSLTVIVPVLADAAAAARLLASLPPGDGLSVVLADGGDDPQLASLAAGRPDTRLVHSSPGRARQMNAGAAGATTDWLIFLHADSVMPAGWRDPIEALPDDVVAGWFRFELDDPAWQARLLEQLVALRVRLFRLPYGDQGLLVRREAFERIGGFAELPLLEDVEILPRLRRVGRLTPLPLPLRTSARRWRADGWVRRSLRNVAIILLYGIGVPPARLRNWYARPGTGRSG